MQQYPTSEFDPPASGYEKSSRFEHPCRKKSPYYEDWFLIHMRSHVLMLSRLIVLHILSVSLTRICSGAAGDSAASPHSSLPGKIISGEANGKHPAILQDISAVYLTSRSIFIRRGGIKLNHTTSGPFIIPRFTVKLVVTESFNQSHELLLIFL